MFVRPVEGQARSGVQPFGRYDNATASSPAAAVPNLDVPAGEEPVTIRVVEHLYRWSNWNITAKSDDFTKKDSQTIEFNVPVTMRGFGPLTFANCASQCATISGGAPPGDFTVVDSTCDQIYSGGADCYVTVRFTPRSTGSPAPPSSFGSSLSSPRV